MARCRCRCLKKRMKKPTLSRNCKRGGGLLSLSWWVQTEADDDDEPTWLVVVHCLKEKEETHPVSQLQARGWVVLGWKKPTPALGIGTGNPGGFQGYPYPYPYPRKPVPVFKGTGFEGYGYGFSPKITQKI